jgi:hypothetical protein
MGYKYVIAYYSAMKKNEILGEGEKPMEGMNQTGGTVYAYMEMSQPPYNYCKLTKNFFEKRMKFCGFLELELARHRTKNTT